MAFWTKAPPIKTIAAPDLRKLLESGAVTLVDVREASEWAESRIPGAIHAPLSRLHEIAAGLPTDKPLVLHCLAGSRSAKALGLLQSLGLHHDTHLAGGIGAWKAHGFPLTR